MAEAKRKELRVVRPETADLPLSRLFELYMADLRLRVSASHHKNIRYSLDTIIGRLGDVESSTLDEPLILAYRSARASEGVSVRTINVETGVTERALRWGKERGFIPINPLAGLKPVRIRTKDVRKKRRSLSDEEYVRFHKAAVLNDERAIELRKRKIPQTPLYLTLLGCGGRRKEVLSTRWRHWNFTPESAYLDGEEVLDGAAEVIFVDTKNGKERILPIPPEVAEAVKALRVIHAAHLGRDPLPSEHVFLSPQGKPYVGTAMANTLRLFYKILEGAGIPRKVDSRTLDLHSCRMTFNQRLIRAGVELGTRQAFLGHADPKTTDGMYSDSGGAERFAALQQLVTRELRRQGASAEDIEEALEAIRLGSDLSVVASPQTRLVVTDGGPLGSVDNLPPKQEVTGSNPVGRTTQAGCHSTAGDSGRPGAVPEPLPNGGPVEVIETSELPPGDVLAVGPALLGPHLSQVMVALAQGRTVVLVGSSHSSRSLTGGNCDDNQNDD